MARNTGRNRRSRQTFTTKNGRSIKLNQSLSDRKKARKAERAAEKALYLSSLPKNKWKRLLARLDPKHLYHYWFSRQGAIMGLRVIGILILFGFFLTIGMFAYFRKDLPQLKTISGNDLGGSVAYYDSSGSDLLFNDYDAIKRTPVNYQQISPYMRDATVAVEDKNFYKEGAFDVRSILRAALNDLTGGNLQGASTITEQLVKLNEGWEGSRTIATKIKEVILAVEVDREYSKQQILTGYLNIAPYSGVDYGVQAAAEDYFRTSAADLTLPQAAMLAAIPQAPTYYSPYGSTKWNPGAGDTFNAQALIARQHYILQQMAKQGYITEDQAQAAEQVNILAEVQPELSKYTNIQDPYFVLAAKQQLENLLGPNVVNRGGLKVTTTLNTKLQADAVQDVKNNDAEVASVGGDEQAMIAEDVHTGQVVALVGGEDFTNPTDGQLNFATLKIEPGSSLKPFMYAALMQNNTDVGAGSVLYDSQTALPGYPCTNKTVPTATSNGGNCLWDDNYEYPGPETIRYALAGSRNVPAVEASLEVDPTDTSADDYTKSVNSWIDMANQAMGNKNAYACYDQGTNVDTDTASQMTQCYGSAVLGSGAVSIANIVNGDTTFANEGQEMPQSYILKVTDASGQVLYQWKQPKQTEVYKPDTAYIINDMLDDPRATYLQPFQKFENYDGWDIAVKTGTENQSYNGVMTAWTTQYAVVGFAGYHTLNKQLELGQFENATEPITKTWIEQALNSLNMKPDNWSTPAGIKSLPSFVETTSTGYGQEVPSPATDVYPSWYVGPGSSKAVTLDKVSGYLATSCTPALAKETLGGSSSNFNNIDIFYPVQYPDMAALEGGTSGKSSSITQTDNVHNCNDTPPSLSMTVANSSGSGTTINVCDGSCSITLAASSGSHPLSGGNYKTAPAGSITVSLGGQTICTISIPPDQSSNYNGSCNYSPTASGSGTFTATVVDSVLYSFTTPGASVTMSPPLSNFTSTSSATSTTFSWSGGIGPYSVYTSDGSQICTASSTSCTTTPPEVSTSGDYVQDSEGVTAH